MVRFIMASAVALALTACLDTWDSGKRLETPVDGYPCGVGWQQCLSSDTHKPTGMCCGENDACGGGPFNGCPAGSCCPTAMGDGLVGAARPYPQRSAR